MDRWNRRPRQLVALLIVSSWIVIGTWGTTAQSTPRPPEQLAEGNGGQAAPYDRVLAWRVGQAPTGAWVFAPLLDDAERDQALPLVVFFHGFSAVDPVTYRAWIDHLARRGMIVVYPDYQGPNLLPPEPEGYLRDALIAVAAVVADLAARPELRIDLDRVATVGHSVGGVLAANYAAIAGTQGLPVPGALMSVEPGGCRGCGGNDRLGTPFAKLELIPAETLALVVVGADDSAVGETGARIIWDGMTNVPLEHRDYVTLVSDRRGDSALIADHFLPSTGGLNGELDALDWYGTWRLFDALTACAFTGATCAEALGNTAEQRFMGTWSDGVPVATAVVTDDPGAP